MKALNIITRYPYVVIIALFLVSALVRVPNLNRPLSKHHEFCTSTCLRTMQIWADSGVIAYNFNPIMNYQGFANKYINNQTQSIFDSNGDTYYMSYPPGAYLLPYFIFRLVGIYPDVLPLQIYNLLLHLTECIFLFKIVMLFANASNKRNFTLIGLMAAAFQLFNPCSLWFHGNVYMTDMQGCAFYIISVFLILKIILQNKLTSLPWFLLLGLSNFTMNYSEYIGVTFSAIAGLYCFIKLFSKRQFILPLIVICLSCFAAIALTLYQYSLINGFHQLAQFIHYRYSYRSGYGKGENFILLSYGVIKNYIIGLLPELVLISLCTILLVLKKKLLSFTNAVRKYFIVLIFLYLPVLLHHFIFLNASQYDFHVLKATAAVSLVCAALLYFIYKNNFFPVLSSNRKPVFIMTVGIILIMNIILYYSENLPGKISRSGQPYEREKVAGLFIKNHSEPQEVIFIKGFEDEPQIVLYAHRNMRTVDNNSDAELFLKTYHRTKGVIFTLDSRGFVIVEKHIMV